MIKKIYFFLIIFYFIFNSNKISAHTRTNTNNNSAPTTQTTTPSTTQTATQTGNKPGTEATPPPAQPLEPASTIEIEYQNEKNLFLPRFANYIALFKPSYILPYYYTKSPYFSVYKGTIPDNQSLKRTEFKAQLSVYLPLVKNLFYNKNLSINIAYTQLLYWQLYTYSAWFREVDYEPNIALRYRIMRNTFAEISLDHQSNGKGGGLERSWNRLIGTLEFSTADLFVQLNGWILLFQNSTSDLNNPKIAYYLGYDKIILSYRLFGKFVLSAEANNIESGYSRGFLMFSGFYPITTKFGAYLQYFYGYGQSLIEYNHFTQAFGLGLALNDWQ